MSSYPSYETVLFEKADGIGWATLNRPDKRNAMSPQLHLEMSDLLSMIEVDPEVRVLVLAGAGEAWCAGMDLKLFFRDLENKPAERPASKRRLIAGDGSGCLRFRSRPSRWFTDIALAAASPSSLPAISQLLPTARPSVCRK